MGHLTESEPVGDPCEDPSPGAQRVWTCSPEVSVKDMGTPQHRSHAVNDVAARQPAVLAGEFSPDPHTS